MYRLFPINWPLFWRRAFILTLPISGTLWCALVFVLALCVIAGAALVLLLLALPHWLYRQLWDRKSWEYPREARR